MTVTAHIPYRTMETHAAYIYMGDTLIGEITYEDVDPENIMDEVGWDSTIQKNLEDIFDNFGVTEVIDIEMEDNPSGDYNTPWSLEKWKVARVLGL